MNKKKIILSLSAIIGLVLILISAKEIYEFVIAKNICPELSIESNWDKKDYPSKCKVNILKFGKLYKVETYNCIPLCSAGDCSTHCENSFYIYDDKNNRYHIRDEEDLKQFNFNSLQIIDSIWMKDKNNLYREGEVFEGINPSAVEILKSTGIDRITYIKDDKNVFCQYQLGGKILKIDNADPGSFVVLNDNFAKDKDNYYQTCKLIPKSGVYYYKDKYNWD